MDGFYFNQSEPSYLKKKYGKTVSMLFILKLEYEELTFFIELYVIWTLKT